MPALVGTAAAAGLAGGVALRSRMLSRPKIAGVPLPRRNGTFKSVAREMQEVGKEIGRTGFRARGGGRQHGGAARRQEGQSRFTAGGSPPRPDVSALEALTKYGIERARQPPRSLILVSRDLFRNHRGASRPPSVYVPDSCCLLGERDHPDRSVQERCRAAAITLYWAVKVVLPGVSPEMTNEALACCRSLPRGQCSRIGGGHVVAPLIANDMKRRAEPVLANMPDVTRRAPFPRQGPSRSRQARGWRGSRRWCRSLSSSLQPSPRRLQSFPPYRAGRWHPSHRSVRLLPWDPPLPLVP